MKKTNPFTLMYGVPSGSIIERNEDFSKIVQSFTNDSYMYMYFISGIRGCGKTVLLRKAFEYFDSNEDWVCVDLNPRSDLAFSLGSKLSEYSLTKSYLNDDVQISLNLPYLTVTKNIDNESNDNEIKTLKIIDKFLSQKKILITIDEIANTNEF